MCGIFGVGNFTKAGMYASDLGIFKQGLIADSVRGLDGTGIVRVSQDGKSDWMKMSGNPFDLFRCTDVYNWLNQTVSDRDRILIGHNRLASVGGASKDNSHPFEHGDFTLVHNGRISNADDLCDGSRDFKVDSESLCFAMSKMGIVPTLEIIEGAYAIVFFDTKEKTLNFYRNNDRPMFLGSHKKDKRLLFGSEAKMLEWLSFRTACNIVNFNELPVYDLVTYTLEGKVRTVHITPKPRPKIYPVSTYTGSQGSFCYSGGDDYDSDAQGWDLIQGVGFIKKPAPIIPFSQTTTYTPPATGYTPSKEMTKRFQYPEQMFGFKKGDPIQFVAENFERTSKTQDQFKVVGSHVMHNEFEIHCFIKGEEKAKELCKASLIKATVRGFERLHNLGTLQIIKVLASHPEIIKGAEESEEEQEKVAPKPALLLLPGNTTVN